MKTCKSQKSQNTCPDFLRKTIFDRICVLLQQELPNWDTWITCSA